MRSADSPSPQGFLFRYPSSWLIITTLALLAGQALAASPILPPHPLSLLLLFLPLPFIFWRGGLAWAVDSDTWSDYDDP